ncbi:MAG: sterol carrier protein domain-containing protein [Acidaminococcaceae bacterium]
MAYRGNTPVGYMLYQRLNRVFKIVEITYVDAEIKNCFLRYARQHRAQCDKLEWLAESDDLTFLNFPDQNHSGSIFPFMMARIIDARRAFELLPIGTEHGEGSFTILLTDNLVKSNNLLLQIDIRDNFIKIEDTFNLPDIEMDISAFTQLYFGQFSLSELVAEGIVAVHSSDAGHLMSDILPKCNNYINEYY